MRTWREFRISREGRHGFLLVLPVFEDTDAPEDAAYEALAGKLGAAPLAPRTPPGPAARLRVSSRSDLEAALNGA